VTSPDPLSIREIIYFGDRLREQNMPRDAVVVNRVRPHHQGRPTLAAVRDAIDRRQVALPAGAEERVLRAFEDEARLGDLDRRNLVALSALTEGPIAR